MDLFPDTSDGTQMEMQGSVQGPPSARLNCSCSCQENKGPPTIRFVLPSSVLMQYLSVPLSFLPPPLLLQSWLVSLMKGLQH